MGGLPVMAVVRFCHGRPGRGGVINLISEQLIMIYIITLLCLIFYIINTGKGIEFTSGGLGGRTEIYPPQGRPLLKVAGFRSYNTVFNSDKSVRATIINRRTNGLVCNYEIDWRLSLFFFTFSIFRTFSPFYMY